MQHDQYKSAFLKQTTIDNIIKSITINSVGLVIAVILLTADYLRYQQGLFAQPWYKILFFCHCLLALLIVPIIWFKKNLPLLKNGKLPQYLFLFYISLGQLGVSLYFMGLFGILDRGSILPFAVFVILFNLFYTLQKRKRLLLNLICLVMVLIGILVIELDSISRIIYFSEILGTMIPVYLVAESQFQLRYKDFASNRLLKDKNESIKATNTKLMLQSLQAQMNPHFIFNTLNSIQHFLVSSNTKESLSYMSKFSSLMRSVFQQSEQNWITLEDEIIFLKLYLEMEQLRFENKIDIQFEVSPELDQISNEVFLPPLLIQPILENAFKHGLMHIESNGYLSIKFKERDACFQCEIEDNGVGRSEANKYEDQTSHQNRLSALNVIQERLDIYNNMISCGEDKRNYIQFIDLYDDNNKPSGTQILLNICMETQRMVHDQSKK